MGKTNFDQITASPEAMAVFLAALPVMSGPWDAAFDRHFCATCDAKDCDAEGCPHQAVRSSVIPWWLKQEVESGGPHYSGG